MIHVLATIEIAPGRRDEFLKEFNALAPTVRAEAGCIEYGPTVDVATGIGIQQLVGDTAVVIVEKWASLDALKAHLVAPHMVAWRERSAQYVKHVGLKVLQPG